jgi:hypothetical protein
VDVDGDDMKRAHPLARLADLFDDLFARNVIDEDAAEFEPSNETTVTAATLHPTDHTRTG